MTTSPDGTLAIEPVTDDKGVVWEILIRDGTVQPWGTAPTTGIVITRNGEITNGGATQIKEEPDHDAVPVVSVAWFLGRNGNWWTSSAFNVWTDRGPVDPATRFVAPPPPSTLANVIASLDLTSGEMTGTAAPGIAQVLLNFDGSQVGGAQTVNVAPDGSWSAVLPPSLLAAGDHYCYAYAITAAGNVAFDNARAPSGFKWGSGGVTGGGDDNPPPVGTTAPPIDTDPIVITNGDLTATVQAVPMHPLMQPLGRGKHERECIIGEYVYIFGKDCAPIPGDNPTPIDGAQDGNQAILRWKVATNEVWLDEPYYVPDSTRIQAYNPDDCSVCASDTEMFYYFSATARSNPLAVPPGNYATPVDPSKWICAWTPPLIDGSQYGTWRIVGPWHWLYGSDRQWSTVLDPVKARFITPVNGQSGPIWKLADRTTVADLTLIDQNGAPCLAGRDQIFSVTGAAIDLGPARMLYVYDIVAPAVWAQSLDTLGENIGTADAPALTQPTKLFDVPEPPTTTQATLKICLEPNINAIIISTPNALHIGDIASKTVTTISPNPMAFIGSDGNPVPPQSIFYDPGTQDVVGYGYMDWSDAPRNPSVFYRIKFARTNGVPIIVNTPPGPAPLPMWAPSTVGEVRALTSNTLNDVWVDNPGNTGHGAASIDDAWGSAALLEDYRTLGLYLQANGGDADSFANDGYGIDLSVDAPVFEQWWPCSPDCADTSTFNTSWGEFADGSPGVGHNYGNIEDLPTAWGGGSKGSFLMPWATFYHQSIYSTGAAHAFDATQKGTLAGWSRASTTSASSASEASFAKDRRRKRMVGMLVAPSAPTSDIYILDFSGGYPGVPSTVTYGNFSMGKDAPVAVHDAYDFFMLYGADENGTVGIRAFDMSTGGFVKHDLLFTGDALPNEPGMGLVCARLDNCIYLRSGASGDEQKYWKITPPISGNIYSDGWTVEAKTMTGAAVSGNTPNGVYRRIREVVGAKSLIFTTVTSQPAYVLRVAA